MVIFYTDEFVMADSSTSTAGADRQIRLFDGVEVPPLRKIDDFILDKARFELPTFNDLPRWNNRIVSNLLYYQSNYFVFFLVCVFLSTFFNAQDMALGMSAIAVVTATAIFSISQNPTCHQHRREHPLITLGIIVVSFYFFITMLGSVFIVVFALALPLLIVLIHASCRLRNFLSKVNQATERLGMRTSLMSRILDVLGVTVKA